LGIARDEPEHLRQMLLRGLQHDVLLVSGGTSVGVHDHVRPTLEALGVQMKFWRVQMKPGHPMTFGTTPTCGVFGLPGNPVSSMVCFEEFVGPALRRCMGRTKLYRRAVSARLARDVRHKHGRTEFVRVTLGKAGARLVATPTGDQGSGILGSMAMAEGLLVVPAASTGIRADEHVEVQLLDAGRFQAETDGEF
jgi:molybdopterin molybdotransferase